jgi:alpha-tubulin suppressor-like RCC1 family protein
MRFLLLALAGLLVFLFPACVQGQTTLAAGGQHFLQIQANIVYAWGYNAYGQLGQGDNINRPTPQPVSLAPAQSGNPVSVCGGMSFSCVLDDNNDLACTGRDSYGQQGEGANRTDTNMMAMPPGVASVAHLACAYGSVLATTTTGALVVWGRNLDGELGVGHTSEVWEPEVSICTVEFWFRVRRICSSSSLYERLDSASWRPKGCTPHLVP